MVALEHRYYGESQPFTNEDGGWSVRNLKWLSTKQALADTAYFLEQLGKQPDFPIDNVVIVGGSYAGAFAAWFKHLYPQHVKAAWSSSGVIEAVEMYDQYDVDLYMSAQYTTNDCVKNFAMA